MVNPCTFLLNIYYLFNYLFIFGCVGSWLRHAGSFIAARRLFIVVCGLLSSCGVWAPEHMGSVVVAYRLSNCCMQAKLLHSMWDLSSLTRDQTRVLCIGRWILNHWTTREVPGPRVLRLLWRSCGKQAGGLGGNGGKESHSELVISSEAEVQFHVSSKSQPVAPNYSLAYLSLNHLSLYSTPTPHIVIYFWALFRPSVIYPSQCQTVSTAIPLQQRSPTFLAPGTSFVGNNFSTGGGQGRGHSSGCIVFTTIYVAFTLYQVLQVILR